MHLMFSSSLHFLGDLQPVGVIQRPQGAVNDLPGVKFRGRIRSGTSTTHGVVFEGTGVEVWVFET